MNLIQFKKRFKEIRDKVHKTCRAGDDGGAGQTLEYLLGLKENNIALPDLGKIELKVHRAKSNCPITLFTFDSNSWVMDQKEVVKKYGKFDKHGVNRLNSTNSIEYNSFGLILNIISDTVTLQHSNGDVLIRWELEDIRERFEQKLPAIMLVEASMLGTKPEKYVYTKATLLSSPSKRGLKNHLLEGHIFVETRLGLKKGVIRNHGTAFRVREQDLKHLFTKQTLI